MRTITLVISEQVYAEMTNAIAVRTISGVPQEILDGVSAKIIDGIKERKKEIVIKYKTEVTDGGTNKRDN